MKCEGKCDTRDGHKGQVVIVHVFNPVDKFDWGNFAYCENAIEQDRSIGLWVEFVRFTGQEKDD